MVVPLVGTWIEISSAAIHHRHNRVVPLVGTWIEIGFRDPAHGGDQRRPPRGDVD